MEHVHNECFILKIDERRRITKRQLVIPKKSKEDKTNQTHHTYCKTIAQDNYLAISRAGRD